MARTFAEAMPGYYLCDLRVPRPIFDRLVAEVTLCRMYLAPELEPFVTHEVRIGNLRVRPQC